MSNIYGVTYAKRQGITKNVHYVTAIAIFVCMCVLHIYIQYSVERCEAVAVHHRNAVML